MKREMKTFFAVNLIYLAGILTGMSLMLIYQTHNRQVDLEKQSIVTKSTTSTSSSTNSNENFNWPHSDDLYTISNEFVKLELNPSTCANFAKLKELRYRHSQLPINSTTGDDIYRAVERYEYAGCR